MVPRMLALSLGQAKTIAIVVMVAFIVLGLLSAWLLKTIVQKVVVLVVLLAFAGVMWFQRDALQDCADQARARADARDFTGELTCSFLGRDVTFRARQ
jgi:protein-S-isoprenylcysteine O-methyltransferase Ste14